MSPIVRIRQEIELFEPRLEEILTRATALFDTRFPADNVEETCDDAQDTLDVLQHRTQKYSDVVREFQALADTGEDDGLFQKTQRAMRNLLLDAEELALRLDRKIKKCLKDYLEGRRQGNQVLPGELERNRADVEAEKARTRLEMEKRQGKMAAVEQPEKLVFAGERPERVSVSVERPEKVAVTAERPEKREEWTRIAWGSIGVNGELCASRDSSKRHPTWCISQNLHPIGEKAEPESKASRATCNLAIDIYKALEKSPSVDTLFIWCSLYSNITTFEYPSKMQPIYIANFLTSYNVSSIAVEVSGTPSFNVSCSSRSTLATVLHLEHAIQSEAFRSGQDESIAKHSANWVLMAGTSVMRRAIEVFNVGDRLEASSHQVEWCQNMSRATTGANFWSSKWPHDLANMSMNFNVSVSEWMGDMSEVYGEVQRGACDVPLVSQTKSETDRARGLLGADSDTFVGIEEPSAKHVEGQHILVTCSLYVAIHTLNLDVRLFIEHPNQKAGFSSQTALPSRTAKIPAIEVTEQWVLPGAVYGNAKSIRCIAFFGHRSQWVRKYSEVLTNCSRFVELQLPNEHYKMGDIANRGERVVCPFIVNKNLQNVHNLHAFLVDADREACSFQPNAKHPLCKGSAVRFSQCDATREQLENIVFSEVSQNDLLTIVASKMIDPVWGIYKCMLEFHVAPGVSRNAK